MDSLSNSHTTSPYHVNVSFRAPELHELVQELTPDELEKYLSTFRGDINKTGENGFPILHCALHNEHFEAIFQLLLSAGADPMAIDSHGNTILHRLTRKGDFQSFQSVCKQIHYSRNYETANHTGYTPMHCAVRSDCAEIVLLLLESNPDLLFLKDHDGNTSVHLAALYHQYDCLYVMLQKHSGLRCLDIINETGKRPAQLVEDCAQPCFSLLHSEVKTMMRMVYPESCVSTSDQLLYESQKAKDILEDEKNQSLVKNISQKIAEKISSLDDGKFEIYKRGLKKSSSQCNYPVSIFIDYSTKAELVGSISAMVNDSERNCVADLLSAIWNLAHKILFTVDFKRKREIDSVFSTFEELGRHHVVRESWDDNSADSDDGHVWFKKGTLGDKEIPSTLLDNLMSLKKLSQYYSEQIDSENKAAVLYKKK